MNHTRCITVLLCHASGTTGSACINLSMLLCSVHSTISLFHSFFIPPFSLRLFTDLLPEIGRTFAISKTKCLIKPYNKLKLSYVLFHVGSYSEICEQQAYCPWTPRYIGRFCCCWPVPDRKLLSFLERDVQSKPSGQNRR